MRPRRRPATSRHSPGLPLPLLGASSGKHESKTGPLGKFHIIDVISISKGWNRMALSKASCTGRGLIPAIGGHVHRMFDEGEDDLFSLSLDDVMDDRPWTADELMSGGARPSSPNPALAPKTASAPTPAQPAVSAPAPTPAPTSAPTPAPRPASDPSETAAFLAGHSIFAASGGRSGRVGLRWARRRVPPARRSQTRPWRGHVPQNPRAACSPQLDAVSRH